MFVIPPSRVCDNVPPSKTRQGTLLSVRGISSVPETSARAEENFTTRSANCW